jgi:tetratricopeptide (TPR) repeat protein
MTSLGIPKEKSGRLHILIIILLGIIVYSNTFRSPFVFDDAPNITENPFIKSFDYFVRPSLVEKISAVPEINYAFRNRIAGFFTFALNFKAHGLNVFGYHLVNLLVHIANALLVYQLVILTFATPYFTSRHIPAERAAEEVSSRTIAFFSALLFVIHPVQTQAVTYIVQRFTELTAFFFLLSIYLYIKARIGRSNSKCGSDTGCLGGKNAHFQYLACIASAVLAMKTKEIAFTLPVIIVLYEFMFFEGKPFKRILYLIPLLSTMLIIPIGLIGNNISLADISVGLNKALAVSSQNSISRWDYLFTQFRVIATYFRLLFLPVGQNIDYDYPIYHSFFNVPVFSSFIILLSVLILGVYLYFRSRRIEREIDYLFRVIAFGIFWFFITISVESSILPIADVIFEHRVYLPSAGFFIGISSACSLALGRFHRSRPAAGRTAALLGALLIVSLASATFARNMVWQSEIALWSDTVNKSPGKVRPHNNLGVAFKNKGLLEEATRVYLDALRVTPDAVELRKNLCSVYARRGLFDKAISECLYALKLEPNYAEAHNNLGIAYMNKGMLTEAIKEYELCMRLNPYLISTHINLCVIYGKQKRYSEAVRECQTALMMRPDDATAKNNLQIIYNLMSGTKP